MTTISVLDSFGNPQSITVPNANGRAADAASAPVALSNEDITLLTSLLAAMQAATPAGAAIIGRIIAQNTGGDITSGNPLSVNVVGGQLGETLWTNDAGTYAIRLDSGGTITFFTPAGAVDGTFGASAGVRPAGDVAAVDKSSYQANTSGTGFVNGDLIDHLVTIDRKTSTVISTIWLNLSQSAVLGTVPTGTALTLLAPSTPVTGVFWPTAATTVAQDSSLTSIFNKLVAAPALDSSLATLHADEVALLAKFPASPGAKAGAGSLSVVMASDAVPANFTPGQIAGGVATTATLIAATRATRQSITIVNESTVVVRLGGAGVTMANGLLLPGIVGASVTIPTTAAIYGIVAAGTAAVSEFELY